jgi:SSS family transporter
MVTRLVADGVRLFATAIPLAILFKGWQTFTDVPNEQIYIISIIIMAVMTLAYVFIGGVRAVIWTDVVQMFIYLIGALAALFVLLDEIPGGMSHAISVASASNKTSIINVGFENTFGEFFSKPYTLLASILGGAFLSMASHGTDQLIVQRLLTTKSLRDSQKALIGSGIIVIVQFAIFLAIGVLLSVYYNGASLADLGLLKADEIFPKFIIERIPTGISGLIIAGLLAAAMSTLSGSVNSLAHATMADLYKPYFGKNNSEQKDLLVSRIVTLVWSVLMVGMAIFFIFNQSKTLVEVALGVASFTYGGLLGLFLLGILSKKVTQSSAIIGFIAGIGTMILVVSFAKIGWTWYTIIGSVTTIVVAHLSRAFVVRGK